MKEHQIQTNGTVLHVQEHSHEGEPVLFLHALLSSGAAWNGVLPFLTDHYHVYTVDLRGHGQSEQPETGYEMENLAEDIRGVLDALCLEKVHLVGSSLGCFVSTCFAAKYPERMLSLVHLDGALENWSGPGGAFAEVSKEQLLKMWTKKEPDFADIEEFYQWRKSNSDVWNEVREHAFWNGDVPSLVHLENGRLVRKTTLSTALQISASMYDLKFEPLYASIRCPVLFLPAAVHPRFSKKEAFLQSFRSKLQNYNKTVIIPETKHLMLLDHYEEVSREILAFYSECQR